MLKTLFHRRWSYWVVPEHFPSLILLRREKQFISLCSLSFSLMSQCCDIRETSTLFAFKQVIFCNSPLLADMHLASQINVSVQCKRLTRSYSETFESSLYKMVQNGLMAFWSWFYEFIPMFQWLLLKMECESVWEMSYQLSTHRPIPRTDSTLNLNLKSASL